MVFESNSSQYIQQAMNQWIGKINSTSNFQRSSPHPHPRSAEVAIEIGFESHLKEELTAAGFLDLNRTLILASGCGSTVTFYNQSYLSWDHDSNHEIVAHIAKL